MAIWLQSRDVVHCSCTERSYPKIQGKKHSQAPRSLNMGISCLSKVTWSLYFCFHLILLLINWLPLLTHTIHDPPTPPWQLSVRMLDHFSNLKSHHQLATVPVLFIQSLWNWLTIGKSCLHDLTSLPAFLNLWPLPWITPISNICYHIYHCCV